VANHDDAVAEVRRRVEVLERDMRDVAALKAAVEAGFREQAATSSRIEGLIRDNNIRLGSVEGDVATLQGTCEERSQNCPALRLRYNTNGAATNGNGGARGRLMTPKAWAVAGTAVTALLVLMQVLEKAVAALVALVTGGGSK
jgi:hypothetical protein